MHLQSWLLQSTPIYSHDEEQLEELETARLGIRVVVVFHLLRLNSGDHAVEIHEPSMMMVVLLMMMMMMQSLYNEEFVIVIVFVRDH